MEFEFERNLGMSCGNKDCHYWDMLELQNCGKEDPTGEPAHWFCPDYHPDQED